MEDRHRKAIQHIFRSLVEQTDLDSMVSALYEKGVFSEAMIEPYRDTRRDERSRKRDLYRDIERRGPRAFRLLVETLTEAGHWDLARDLDPNSSLHITRPPRPIASSSFDPGDNRFVSISTQKKKAKSELEQQKNLKPPPPKVNVTPAPLVPRDPLDPVDPIPHFEVKKSTKFVEESKDVQLYRTRGRYRGVLVVLSYVSFDGDVESYRKGANVDCDNLKYLFDELGFKVLSYKDLTKEKTLETLASFKQVLGGYETVFIVVSSHGHARVGSDTDIRCSDGGLVSFYSIIHYFNNHQFSALKGIPKVFIFQLCRGDDEDWTYRMEQLTARDGTPLPPGPPAPRDRLVPPSPPLHDRLQKDRLYSDILIAHSTLPGYVSHRNARGSWYIQALCDVFAARAHDLDVERLFTLVDKRMHDQYHVQTSSVDRWGFNKSLYLHPGLYEDTTD